MNNLNKKTIIQIVVIAIAFGGSAFVLYKGFAKKTPPAGIFTGETATVASAEKILPYGDTLDFDKVLKKQSLNFGAVIYPKLDPKTEVGVPEQDLIKSAVKVQQ